jgi:hypothetical protein
MTKTTRDWTSSASQFMTDVVAAIGPHRIFCGDATNPEHVACLLGDAKPNLMVTDPPYGVDYDATWRRKRLGGRRAEGAVQNDDRADWCEAWQLFPGSVAYVWQTGTGGLEAAGFDVRAQIVWVKNRPVISRGNYHWQHETCCYAVRGSVDGWQHERRQSTVWQIEHLKSDTGHSTQKPVDCMRLPIVKIPSPETSSTTRSWAPVPR